jgi:AMP deaminase
MHVEPLDILDIKVLIWVSLQVHNKTADGSPGLYQVRTTESDGDDGPHGNSGPDSEASGEEASAWNDKEQSDEEDDGDEGNLEAGMLLRDRPKRTTFYDPVAERQMSQTDAKLFYQRSKLDIRSGGGTWSHTTPAESPVLVSGSQPGTEYGGDSLVLDDPKSSGNQGSSHRQEIGDSMASSPLGSRGGFSAVGSYGSALGSKAGQATAEMRAAHAASMGLGGSSMFDTEPEITSELSSISKNIQKIVDTRRRYIALSSQGPEDNPRDHPDWEIYPPPPEPAWRQNAEDAHTSASNKAQALNGLENIPEQSEHGRRAKRRKPGHDVGEDFSMDDLLPLPGNDGWAYRLDESGVFQVFENEDARKPLIDVPTIREYYMNLDEMLIISSDGPSKSFAFRRLEYLEAKFNLYALLNEYQETADSKKVPHRDFYNVRKVDTHVHHSACMNQKHLLRFIKSKMKKFPNEVVLFRDGKHLTLAEVFASINLTAYDLSIDTLDMHVSSKKA